MYRHSVPMNLLYILPVPLRALGVLPACSVTLSILMSVWVKSCSHSLFELLNLGFIKQNLETVPECLDKSQNAFRTH